MNTASNKHLSSAKRDTARPVLCSSFGEIVKHKKRNPISGPLGDAKLSQNYPKRLKTVPCGLF